MTDPTWRDELVDEAKKWPASFRAELSAGHWRLQGANEDVYRALKFCAERFVREIRLPLSDADPIDVLLDHLNEGGEDGRIRRTTASVSPLRDALIEYLNAKKDVGAQNKGDAAVAKKNREIKVRHQIVEAFQRLEIPQRDWPDFVRGVLHETTTNAQSILIRLSRFRSNPLFSTGCMNLHRSGRRGPTLPGSNIATVF